MTETTTKPTRSWRQAGKQSVPVEQQRIRILTALAAAQHLPMSAMAYAAFPDYEFRTPQGAALAVSGTVRALYDDKLVLGASYGYQISHAGRTLLEQQAASEVQL